MLRDKQLIGLLIPVLALTLGLAGLTAAADRGYESVVGKVSSGQSLITSANVPSADPQAAATTSTGDIFPTATTVSENVIAASVFSGGGNSGSSSSFRLSGTVSQVAVGSGVYGVNRADHGFWNVLNALSVTPCCGLYTGGLTGNTNCDPEGRRDILDITVLIDHVYISQRDLCCPANGNLDPSNGEMINLADITRLIDFVYISHAETAPCQ